MKMLSMGMPSTLGNWHEMSKALFGEESPATAFIKEKLDEQGPEMEVIADEGQLLLMQMHRGSTEKVETEELEEEQP